MFTEVIVKINQGVRFLDHPVEVVDSTVNLAVTVYLTVN